MHASKSHLSVLTACSDTFKAQSQRLLWIFVHTATSKVTPGKSTLAVGTSELAAFAGASERLAFVSLDAGTSVNEHES